jgi:hypothetical protein
VNDLSFRAAAVVNAGRGALRPSAADRERVSAALRACLGDAALPLEAGALTSLFSASAWAKVSAIGAAVGIIGGATFLASRDSGSAQRRYLDSARPDSAHVSPAAPVPSILARGTSSEPTAPKLAAAEPNAGAARRPSDRLAQEVAILSQATSALHAGRAASALSAIDEHQRKFPNGLLAEERRVARVQALCALGRRAEAEPELQRLVRQAPQSPNTLRAQQLCGVQARQH